MLNLLIMAAFDLAVPFEEDDKDPRIRFLDHNYHESVFSILKSINGACCWVVQDWSKTKGERLGCSCIVYQLELFDHAQGFIPPSTLPAYAGAVARHHPTAPPVSATVGRDHTAHAAEPASVTPPQMLGQPQPSQSAAYGQARGDSPGSFPASTSPLVLPAVPGSIKDSGGDWRLGGAAADNSELKSVG